MREASMTKKKLFAVIITVMLLIAALGCWAIVDGVIAHNNRALITDFTRKRDTVS